MLLVPRVMYGTYKDVKKASAVVAKKLFKGVSVEEAYTEQGFVDVEEVRRPIVMSSHPGDGMEAVFPGMAINAYREKIYKAHEEITPDLFRPVFEHLIASDWGTLTSTTDEALICFWEFMAAFKKGGEPDPILFQYLKAAAEHWDTFEEIGPHYFWGSVGYSLWQQPSTLRYVLANFKVPKAVLDAPLPAEGLWSIYPAWVKERIEAATV